MTRELQERLRFSRNLLNDLTERGMLAEVTNDKGQG